MNKYFINPEQSFRLANVSEIQGRMGFLMQEFYLCDTIALIKGGQNDKVLFSHEIIFLFKITESQNSRGWKGPLWVI